VGIYKSIANTAIKRSLMIPKKKFDLEIVKVLTSQSPSFSYEIVTHNVKCLNPRDQYLALTIRTCDGISGPDVKVPPETIIRIRILLWPQLETNENIRWIKIIPA